MSVPLSTSGRGKLGNFTKFLVDTKLVSYSALTLEAFEPAGNLFRKLHEKLHRARSVLTQSGCLATRHGTFQSSDRKFCTIMIVNVRTHQARSGIPRPRLSIANLGRFAHRVCSGPSLALQLAGQNYGAIPAIRESSIGHPVPWGRARHIQDQIHGLRGRFLLVPDPCSATIPMHQLFDGPHLRSVDCSDRATRGGRWESVIGKNILIVGANDGALGG